jgi:alkaline phosphatase
MDAFPFTGEQTTWSVKPGAGPSLLPDYVPDSASTGTAWATGSKTIDERISQGPSTALDVPGSNDLPTVLEQAQKAAAGLGSIAEQMVDHQVDVILGGGKARFDQPLEDGGTETVADYAQSDKGYKLVTDANGLAGVNDIRKPVLGLFNKSNMSLEWNGPDAQTQQADGTYGAPVTCARDQRPANEPSLSDMTTKALSLLEQKGSGKGKGLLLQVEGASIDKRDHAANPCQQIGETVGFDKAIGVALAYQRAHPDTLVVLTADHGQTIRISYGTAGGLTRPAPQRSASSTPAPRSASRPSARRRPASTA